MKRRSMQDAIRAAKGQRRSDNLALLGNLLKWILPVVALFMCFFFLATRGHADDFQCTAAPGCTAKISTPEGVKEVKFRKGDIVSTGDGWFVDEREAVSGWRKVDLDVAIAGLLPVWAR